MSPQQHTAIACALFAVFLALGVVVMPYASDLSAAEEIVNAALAGPGRMRLAGMLIAVGFGFGAAALPGLWRRLADAGQGRIAWHAIPFITVGGAFLLLVGGAVQLGAPAMVDAADDATAEEVLSSMARPVEGGYAFGSLLFAIGWIAMGEALRRAAIYPRVPTLVILGALAVFGLAHFFPAGWGLYLHAAAGLVAFGLLAYYLWTEEAAARPRQIASPL